MGGLESVKGAVRRRVEPVFHHQLARLLRRGAQGRLPHLALVGEDVMGFRRAGQRGDLHAQRQGREGFYGIQAHAWRAAQRAFGIKIERAGGRVVEQPGCIRRESAQRRIAHVAIGNLPQLAAAQRGEHAILPVGRNAGKAVYGGNRATALFRVEGGNARLGGIVRQEGVYRVLLRKNAGKRRGKSRIGANAVPVQARLQRGSGCAIRDFERKQAAVCHIRRAAFVAAHAPQ